jgi:hypothetical protein
MRTRIGLGHRTDGEHLRSAVLVDLHCAHEELLEIVRKLRDTERKRGPYAAAQVRASSAVAVVFALRGSA